MSGRLQGRARGIASGFGRRLRAGLMCSHHRGGGQHTVQRAHRFFRCSANGIRLVLVRRCDFDGKAYMAILYDNAGHLSAGHQIVRFSGDCDAGKGLLDALFCQFVGHA